MHEPWGGGGRGVLEKGNEGKGSRWEKEDGETEGLANSFVKKEQKKKKKSVCLVIMY